MSDRKYSKYYEELERSVQERYRVKLVLVKAGMDDPYTFDPDPVVTEAMPEVEETSSEPNTIDIRVLYLC